MKMLSSIGLECIVSPKNITANNILRYIRGLGNADGSSVQTLYKIVDGKAEALRVHSGGQLRVPEGADKGYAHKEEHSSRLHNPRRKDNATRTAATR